MTDEEIVRLYFTTANQVAGKGNAAHAIAFARAIAAAEREVCARVCEAQQSGMDYDDRCCTVVGDSMAKACAAAIRARGTDREGGSRES